MMEQPGTPLACQSAKGFYSLVLEFLKEKSLQKRLRKWFTGPGASEENRLEIKYQRPIGVYSSFLDCQISIQNESWNKYDAQHIAPFFLFYSLKVSSAPGQMHPLSSNHTIAFPSHLWLLFGSPHSFSVLFGYQLPFGSTENIF